MRMNSMTKYFWWAFDGYTWVIMIMMTKPRDETYRIEHDNLKTFNQCVPYLLRVMRDHGVVVKKRNQTQESLRLMGKEVR